MCRDLEKTQYFRITFIIGAIATIIFTLMQASWKTTERRLFVMFTNSNIAFEYKECFLPVIVLSLSFQRDILLVTSIRRHFIEHGSKLSSIGCKSHRFHIV